MKSALKVVFTLSLWLVFSATASAQLVYAIRNLSTIPAFSQPPGLIILNLSTCSFCYILPLNAGIPNELPVDLVNWPTGEVVALYSTISPNPPFTTFLDFYDLPNAVPVNTVTLPDLRLQSMVFFNGVLYATAGTTLYSINTTTWQVTDLGAIPVNPPPDIGFFLQLFEYNGQLYALRTNQVILVNTADPSASTLAGTFTGVVGDALTIGGTIHISAYLGPGQNGVYQYTLGNNSLNPQVCGCDDFVSNPIFYNPDFLCSPPYGLIEAPANHPYVDCLCTTDAGAISISNTNLCSTPLVVTVSTPAELEQDDLVRYIVFSDINDPEGSIVAISSSPTIQVDLADIQLGVTYYVAAIAGNNLNGFVDFSDPCFSISNIIPVIWRPRPELILETAQTDVCQGNCTEITATLTAGTPPFTFTYQALSGNNVVTTATLTATQSPFTFTVCLPPAVPIGQVNIQVTALTDQFCTCP